MDNLVESFETPVKLERDVIVVGGGVAGIASSIASARNGAKTVLIERYGFLGGVATAGLMNSMNGFRNQRKPNHIQTVRGIAEEIVLEMHELGGCWISTAYEQEDFDMTSGELPYAVAFDPEIFKYVVLKLLIESGVELLLHTYAVKAVKKEESVIGTIVENKGGRAALIGKIVVDASGDGDIAYSAGAPYMQASKDDRHVMGASLMLRIGNLPPGFGVPAGSDTAVTWGPATRLNGTDPFDITRAELEVRMKAIEFVENLRKREGFQSASLLETAFQIGIRETRRLIGEYVLTKEDAENDVRFEDAIAISSNPVPSYYGRRFFYNHLGFDVPYRCVIAKSVDGLFQAGRNISMEQAPWQSARSMAPNMAIAQAAGTAAAICAKKECQPREIDAKRLRYILRDQGAVMER
jgi:hypothetical protein